VFAKIKNPGSQVLYSMSDFIMNAAFQCIAGKEGL